MVNVFLIKNKLNIITLLGLFASFSSFAKETRKRVVIIGTGVDITRSKIPRCSDVYIKDFTGTSTSPSFTHETNVSNVIYDNMLPREKYRGKYCATFLKTFKNEFSLHQAYIDSLIFAFNLKPAVINISLSGSGYSKSEHDLLLLHVRLGAFVVAASGNSGVDCRVHKFYPASHPFVISVGSHNREGKRESYSNYGCNQLSRHVESTTDKLGQVTRLVGTSFTAPIVTAEVLKILIDRD